MTLIVCPLSQVERLVAERAPSHLITLLDPSFMIDTPAGLLPHRHLRLGVNDIVEPVEGRICPDEPLMDRLLAFGDGWEGDRPLLVHCWAGVSRSTATAFVLACQRNPAAPELTIARALRGASRAAHPNRRIVALADARLGRQGRMVEAIAAIGPGEMVEENQPFDLPARYP